MCGDQLLYAPEKPKNRLEKISETLSLIPCILGFHNYRYEGHGGIYDLYSCNRCGKEDIDC